MLKDIDIEKIEDMMLDTLPPKRYAHSFAVSGYAADLARIWGVDAKRAFNTGLLHDMMHYLTDEEYLAEAERYGLPVGEAELENPMLLHGPLAAAVLEQDWGCDDKQMLDAIRWHTVPNAEMDDLAKIVYLADNAEPGREFWPGLGELRELAQTDLNAAMVMAIEGTIDYLQQQGKQPHPDTAGVLAAFRQMAQSHISRRNDMTINTKPEMSAEEILHSCIELAEEKKAKDITTIALAGQTIISDYFVIATASSVRQAQSICDNVEEGMKQLGCPPVRIEGYRDARWILLDFSVVVMHIFQEEERAFYDLERLWSGSERKLELADAAEDED